MSTDDQGGATRRSTSFWPAWICGVILLSVTTWVGARFDAERRRCEGQSDCVQRAAEVAVFLRQREPTFLDLLQANLPEDTGPPEEDDEDEEGSSAGRQKLLKHLVKPAGDEDVPDWLKHKDEVATKTKNSAGKTKKKVGLYGLKGPRHNTDPHLAKRLAQDAARNAGVLGLLKKQSTSHIASIFGRDPRERGRSRPDPLEVTPSVKVGLPEVQGPLKVAVVKEVLQRHREEVERCYRRTFSGRAVEAARKEAANRAAQEVSRLGVQLVIRPNGWATAAAVRRADTYHHEGETCLNQRMRGWRFHKGGPQKFAVADVPLVLTWRLARKKSKGRK